MLHAHMLQAHTAAGGHAHDPALLDQSMLGSETPGREREGSRFGANVGAGAAEHCSATEPAN